MPKKMPKIEYEKISEMFEKIDKLQDKDKLLIRRAYQMPFKKLSTPQIILFMKITGGEIPAYKLDFLRNMMAIYVNQKCKGSILFENCLKDLYRNGSASAQQRIGYMIDEKDLPTLYAYVTRYAEMFSQKNNVDIISLAYDVLNWTDSTRYKWIRTIAGTKEEEENE